MERGQLEKPLQIDLAVCFLEEALYLKNFFYNVQQGSKLSNTNVPSKFRQDPSIRSQDIDW